MSPPVTHPPADRRWQTAAKELVVRATAVHAWAGAGISRLGVALVVIAATAMLGASGASASAGAPIVVSAAGSDADPSVVVDSQGTAHIVWSVQGSAPDSGITDYCQIAARGTSCTDHHTFEAPAYGASRVLLGASPGEIVVLSGSRYVDAWVSMDDGQTFSSGPNGAAGAIAAQFPSGDPFPDEEPVFGPGGFSASWLTYSGEFENFPINAGPPVNSVPPIAAATQGAQLFTGCGGTLSTNSVALLNDTTPVAECDNPNTGVVYYRVATGNGNLDDTSTGSWGPLHQVIGQTGGVGAWVAGGPRGVYLLYNASDGSADVSELVNGVFGSPTVIAKNTNVEGFSEDQSGDLFVVTQDADYPAPGSKDERVFTSADGAHWTDVALDLRGLNTGREAFAEISGCAAAAGGDDTGSGFIVGQPEVRGATAIYAESFGKSPCGGSQGTGGCPTHLVVGLAHLTATSGCFAAGEKGRYTTSDQFELNGLMISPGGQVTIDTVNHTVSTGDSSASVKASYIVLDSKPFDWLIPGGASATMIDLRNHGEPVQFSPSANGSTLAGFTINGAVTPALQSAGRTALPMNVLMPSPIGGFIGNHPSADVDLTAGDSVPGGLQIGPGDIKIDIPDVSLGIAQLKPFQISYDGDPNVFDGHINIILPVIGSSLNTHFRFEQGSFVEGDATANLGMTVPVASDAFLTQVGLSVYGKHGGCPAADWSPGNPGPAGSASPTYIGGNLNVGLGPISPSDNVTGVFNVDGAVSYTFPESQCDEPGVFSITGQAKLFGFPVANGFMTYKTDGDLAMGAGFDIGPSFANIQGNVGGELATQPQVEFDLYGNVKATLLGLSLVDAKVIVSSIGINGCLAVAGENIGELGYRWGGSVSGSLFSGCDIDSFVPSELTLPAGFSRHGLASTASTYGVQVPRGVPVEGIDLLGAGAAPLVRLTGPGGQQVTTPAPATAGASAMSVTRTAAVVVVDKYPAAGADTGVTEIKLQHPQAGKWTVTPLPVSPAITNVLTAKGLPAISVHARVTRGKGRARFLVYENTPATGRTVTFIEKQAGGALHRLGATAGKLGRIRFLPGPGPAGRRAILAEVTERGMAAAQLPVASYVAPGPPKLGKPKAVRVKRIGSRIKISWRGVNGAARFVVRAMLADGRSLVLLERPSARSVTVPAVQEFDEGSVMVAALNSSNQPGPIGTVTLKAAKPTCKHPAAVRGKLVCGQAKHKKHKKHKKAKQHVRHR